VGVLLPANPTVEVQAAARRTQAGDDDLDRGIQIAQTFEVGGQRGLRLAALDAEEASAAAQVAAVQRRLVAEVALAAAQVWSARQNHAFSVEQRSAAEALVAVARAREQQGLGSGLDADLSIAAALAARRDERAATQALREAENQLALAVGSDVRLSEDAGAPEVVDVAETEHALETRAVNERAEVAKARGDAAVARKQVAVLERERVPDITAAAGIRHEELSNIIGGSLTIPLPLFRRNQGEIAEQQVHVAQADSAVRLQELQVRLQVRAAYASWLQAKSALVDVPPRLAERLAADSSALTNAYQTGSLPLTTVLASLRETYAARRTVAALHVDAAAAALGLAEAAALPIPLGSKGSQP